MKAALWHMHLMECPVAPLVGAWIERKNTLQLIPERDVAPLVGAWIESQVFACENCNNKGRSSCRSVD